MKIIFQVNGGIGKSVAATAVCKAIKTQHPAAELVVITGYPEVFMQNPHVGRVLTFNNLNYFYQDHIEGQDTKLMLQDPYNEEDFIYQRGHLIKVWCEMNGIVYNGEMPELFIRGKEKTTFAPLFNSDKPIMVIQTNGGVPNQTDKYSWPRDLPLNTAQRIVNAFAHEYNVVHLRRQDQLPLQNTWPVTADFRQLAVLLMMSRKRLFIDSFAQHVSAALGLPSVVCWVANVPSQFGYDMHTNIMANQPTLKPELRNAVFNKYNIMGQPIDFPYNSEDEIFDADKIIAALRGSTELTMTAGAQQPSFAEATAGDAGDKKKALTEVA
ncbi:MAG: hypothetical protein JWQ38_2125 [Flavipsychrobacter sp.]|nr:hypothetical protein [Flavipsychrobacter sp.]